MKNIIFKPISDKENKKLDAESLRQRGWYCGKWHCRHTNCDAKAVFLVKLMISGFAFFGKFGKVGGLMEVPLCNR